MPRLPRNFIPGLPQHVIQRGNDRQAIFVCDADRRRYLNDLAGSALSNECVIHAYVLMTNHVHLLATPTLSDSLSRMMQSMGRRYVRYFNNQYRRTGTLWEGRFKAALVDSERYLLTCMRYIELNPVRAGLTTEPQHYSWSSHGRNAYGDACPLISEHAVYSRLGSHELERQSVYRALFSHDIVDEDLARLRRATQRGEPLGDEIFTARISEMLDRPVTRLTHGGDRKSQAFVVPKDSSNLTP